MYCAISSGALVGVSAYPVNVEVDMARGLPGFSMVGSLAGEVRESRDRVQVALKNVGLHLPPTHITVNLSPADQRKEGTAFDLPIAVGILQAMEYFPKEATEGTLFLGELGLNGEVKPVRGVLPIVKEAAARGMRECIVPMENALEAAVIPGICVRGVKDIRQLLEYLAGKVEVPNDTGQEALPRITVDTGHLFSESMEECGDFSQVYGQETAKRAALIAAAGFHNLLLVGPPGAGKTMIAKRIRGILPPLTLEESLEVTAIMSVAGNLGDRALVTSRPFQSPHHSISQPALIGGSRNPKPGVISLAHRGVLFLDELPEFDRATIDCMRQPMEEHVVQIARSQSIVTYPADFMLVCAMNPCPCGYYPDRNRCRCTQAQVDAYVGKVSGPILDRIDLCVELQTVDLKTIREKQGGAMTLDKDIVREQVLVARKIQSERFSGCGKHFNADMDSEDVKKYCVLGVPERECAEEMYETMQLSMRGYHRLLKVARTIADLDEAEDICVEHLLEAACFRPLIE